MLALYVESHCKDGHVMTSDPIKFVETEADAKAFCGNPDNGWRLRAYGDYKSKEFVYKEWSLGDFAEYCRQRFDEISERFDSHRL